MEPIGVLFVIEPVTGIRFKHLSIEHFFEVISLNMFPLAKHDIYGLRNIEEKIQ